MRKAWKVLQYLLLGIIALLVIGYAVVYFSMKGKSNDNMELFGVEAPLLTANGI